MATKQPIPITGVHVRNTGQFIICEVEINGVWVEVINQYAGPMEFNIGHIVEWRGIRSAMERKGVKLPGE